MHRLRRLALQGFLSPAQPRGGASLGTVGGKRSGARWIFIRKPIQHRLFYGGAVKAIVTQIIFLSFIKSPGV
jgi:hypothetical protein